MDKKGKINSQIGRIGRIGDPSPATELDDLIDHDDAHRKLYSIFQDQFTLLEQELQKEPNWDKLKKVRIIMF